MRGTGHIQIEEYTVGVDAVQFIVLVIAERNGVRIAAVADLCCADPNADVHAGLVGGVLKL